MIHPDMEQFLRFVESKRPEQCYRFSDWDNCACAQFAEVTCFGIQNWKQAYADEDPFWRTANRLAEDNYDSGHNATFGALADRVRRYIHTGEIRP